MAETTSIEWTDATWNPITGCSIVSPGCSHCYAMKLAGTRLQHHPSRAGLTTMTKAGPVWNGKVRFNEEWLTQPLRWKRPRRIFVCAHGDLFHPDVPDEWIDRIFAVMALAPQHTFQVLTKRADRMRQYFDWFRGADPHVDRVTRQMWEISRRRTDHIPGGWPLSNVWLGVSVEDQQRADERIPHLVEIAAAERFISAEPLLSELDLREWIGPWDAPPMLDWVIVGGESGPQARPSHPDWFRSLRDQCQAADVPFFFKQWGEFLSEDDAYDRDMPCIEAEPPPSGMYRVGKKAAGRLLDGREWNELPQVTP